VSFLTSAPVDIDTLAGASGRQGVERANVPAVRARAGDGAFSAEPLTAPGGPVLAGALSGLRGFGFQLGHVRAQGVGGNESGTAIHRCQRQ